MREYIGANDIANQVSMMRSVHNGTILLVEGATDKRLYRKMVDQEECEVLICHSKDNVRIAVRELFYRRKDKKVLGIMDADIDRLTGNSHEPPLFLTDRRDAEMMMIDSQAFDDVIWEYGEEEKLEDFAERYGSIREAVVEASYPIGLLMYVSRENDLGLAFKDLEYGRFIDPATMKINIRDMVDEVSYNSRDPQTNRKHIRNLLVNEMNENHDPWDVSRGHDAVAIMLIGLKRTFGSYNARNLRCGELGGALRLAYSMDDFQKTKLFRDTKEWCSRIGAVLWITEDLPLQRHRTSP